jgi:hypothetical protein
MASAGRKKTPGSTVAPAAKRTAKTAANQPGLTKDQRIWREYDRMKELFASMPENELRFCDPLLQNAAFMAVTLQDLQVAINANGVTDIYQNGANQSGTKASADLQAYNSLAKVYNALMEKLSNRLPKENKKSRLAALRDE